MSSKSLKRTHGEGHKNIQTGASTCPAERANWAAGVIGEWTHMDEGQLLRVQD